jgi:tetratricopeptide (TPR) repeat protein
MKNVLKSKIVWASAALVLSLGIVGCNIFNPTESVNIKSDDAAALSYEGYIKFRDNEYSEAEEYFNKAIAADSTYSEAWLGLMKSILSRKLNSNEKTNVFSLLQYVNSSREGGKTVPFANMPESLAVTLEVTLDTVETIAKELIRRDTLGLTDGKITYKYISDGYMVIQMMKTMLVLRKTTSGMDECSFDSKSENKCDMETVLNRMKGDSKEAVAAFNGVFNTCAVNSESMATLFDTYLEGFDNLTDDAKNKAIQAMCAALAQETEIDEDNPDKQEKTMNIIIGQFGYSDIVDDDGDGCVDEEVYDGEDNDGDGEIDEDVRDKTNPIKYDDVTIMNNIAHNKTSIRDLRVVKEAGPNSKYEKIDIDMNGEKAEDNEWEFVYSKYTDRVKKNDHRFKFIVADEIEWNPNNLSDTEFRILKYNVAHDTDPDNLKYDLEFRKKNIGGCWKNYSEKDFEKWFEGRNN